MGSKLFVIAALVAAAVLGVCGVDTEACPPQAAAVVGFAPQACSGAYTASFTAAPQPASYWMAPAAFYQPPPAQFVQAEVAYAPQPQQLNVVYQQQQRAQVVGFAKQYNYGAAAIVGAPVALHGRFAGNPAVGLGSAQLNLGGGRQRERVLRPTLFKRAVGNTAAVGAVVVQPY